MASQIQYWSTTPASNASADADISSSDSQSPASLDDNVRSIMAGVAKYADDTDGGLTAGGSANALTVTTNQVLTSGQLTAGLTLQLKAPSANSSATVTFAPDGLTAQAIKRADGSALAVGVITAGMKLILSYNSGTSEWWALNISPLLPAASVLTAATPAVTASFRATKNSVDQTVSTGATTAVTFGTEDFDVGSHFASNTWTPPAGTILVIASLRTTNVNANEGSEAIIVKNGSAIASSLTTVGTSGGVVAQVSFIDQSNGTDTYSVSVVMAVSDSSYTVSGDPVRTFFCGTMI